MKFRIDLAAACCVASLLLAAPASAQVLAAPEIDGRDWLRLQLRGHLRDGSTWSEVEQHMLALFRASEIIAGGVTADSARIRNERLLAQRRAAVIQQRLVLDLDNDGIVSRDEMIASFNTRTGNPLQSNGIMIEPTPEQRKAVLDRLVADALKDDTDGNGQLDFAEMRAAAQQQITRQMGGPMQDPTLVPMSLDSDRDGTVTRTEYTAAARAVFEEIDTTRDDRIDAAELQAASARIAEAERARSQALQAQRQAAEQAKKLEACNIPTLSAGAKLVVFGAYEGRALSTVSLGGDDVEVTVGDIVIEDGDETLDLVLLSYDAQIWRLRGAVGRIGRVVASSYQRAGPNDPTPRVGVVGIPREKLAVPRRSDCLPYFSGTAIAERSRSIAAVTALAKRPPDAVFGTYGVSTVTLPSGRLDEKAPLPGTVELPNSGPASGIWREMLRFNPSGMVRIDPTDVVSALPARSYAVLPQQAGLAQLVEEGALTVEGNGRSFIITRKIRFPAGLNGAHSVKFVLGRDVPAPEGSPGHSCVLSEATGTPVGMSRPGC